MSLINDALRKARQEAAEQAASERRSVERGLAYRPPRAHRPPPRRTPALLVGTAIGLCLAIVLVAAVWFLRSAPAAAPVPDGVVVEGTTSADAAIEDTTSAVATVSDAALGDAAIESTGVEVPPSIAESVPPADGTSFADGARAALRSAEPLRSGPRPTEPRGAPALGQEPGTLAATALEPARSPSAPAASAPDSAEAAPVRSPPSHSPTPATPSDEASLGGVTARLDFIVWSSTEPFAQINGSLVSVGQAVDGFLVEAVEREQVTLERGGERVVLRVR